MKPKMLKISGLNSFLEVQEVDFEELTKRGLFGIFGSTGSGKSSILDAMTLSLYGQVARKSSMFINTETEKLFVSFEFEAGYGKDRKTYRVERSLKKTKTGGTNTVSAKLITFNKDGNQESIIENRTFVESELQNNIIGLNFEDFIRTVVLPQGKFSEFLTLTGSERNKMLERILGLEDYGDRLSQRIKQRRDLVNDELNRVYGEFNRYEDTSVENKEQLDKELEELNEKEKQIDIQIKQLNKEYEKYKKVWELQQELAQYVDRQSKIDQRKEEFETKKNKLKKGKHAYNVLPYIESLERTYKEIEKNNQQLELYKVEIDRLNLQVGKNEKEYNITLDKKDKELPVLIIRKSKIEQAIDLLTQKETLENERDELSKNHNELEENIKADTEKKHKLLEIKDKIETEIEEKEKLINDKTISPEYREKLTLASDLEKRWLQILKDKESYLIDKNKIMKSIQNNNVELEGLLENLYGVDKLIQELNSTKTKLEDSKPEDSKTISEYQKNSFELTYEIKKYKDTYEKSEGLKKLIAEILNECDMFDDKYSKLDGELKIKQNELQDTKVDIKELEYRNIASKLSEQLIDSEPCPVCGSIHHPNPVNPINNDEIESKQLLIDSLEKETVLLNNNLSKLEVEIKTKKNEQDKNQKELEAYIEFLSNINIEALENEKVLIDDKIEKAQEYKLKWDTEYKNLNDKLVNSSDERNILVNKKTEYETNIKRDKDVLDNLSNKVKELEVDLVNTSSKYELQIKELEIGSAEKRLIEVNKLDKEVEIVNAELRTFREENKELDIKKLELEKRLSSNKEDIKVTLQLKDDKEKRIHVLNIEITQIVGQEEPNKLKEQVEKTINEIIRSEEELKKSLETEKTSLNKLNEERSGLEKAIKAYKGSSDDMEGKLNSALIENSFVSKDEAICSYLDKKIIEELENEIEIYNNHVKDTINNISRINKELGAESIKEEEWKAINIDKDQAYKDQNNLSKEIGEKKSIIHEMVKNLGEIKRLKEETNRLERKKDMLSDIFDLTKGKKFVEYVSRSHLNYIARGATEKLKEITRGRYGLELDTSNNFTVVDHHNGSARRECNSLSGGETFLTSLSLALALSSKIQLKGNTSLEFFFLDEGFGTLDNSLLDVVMTSLERLHREDLSVGIISHVEELKNRVPVKLLVTAPVSGMHGTKVKIEYS